jgi:hypothetical protein
MKRHRRWPMLIIWSTLVLILLTSILSLAGVQPLSGYKDQIIAKVKSWNSTIESTRTPVATQTHDLVGKWTKYGRQGTIQFLKNGTIIVDDGSSIFTGTYEKTTDEYLTINDYTGMPQTMYYEFDITGDFLHIRYEYGGETIKGELKREP